jgi:Phage tail protein
MANEISVKFNNLALDDGTYNIGKIDFSGRDTINAHTIPKSNETILETARRGALEIRIEGMVLGTEYDNLRTNIDALRAALRNGEQQFIIDDDRYILARLKDFDYSYTVMRRVASFSANFIAGYPYWRAVNATSDESIPTSGEEYTLTNNGNASARCKVEITATGGAIADDCIFNNITAGIGFKFRGTIASGKTLIVDNRYSTDNFIVTNDGSDAHANYEGDFISLDAGANSVEFVGVAGTTVKVTYKDTWEA